MRTRITRVIAVAAAIAAASVGLIATSASANTAGAAPTGAITLSPSPATTAAQLGALTINPPSGAACAGDTNAGGYRWQTFLSNAADPNVLTFNASGPVGPAGTINFPLYSSLGSPIVNQGTAAVTGLLVGFPATYSLTILSTSTVTSGVYNIGFACTVGGVSDRLWFSPVTIVSAGPLLGVASITFGATPPAPVLSGLTSTLTSCSVTIAAPAATPVASAISLVATPTAPILTGAVTVTVPLAANATSGTASGLVAGQTYNVSATQTNAVGTSPVSNVLACTASVQVAAPGVLAAPAAKAIIVSWSAVGTPTSFTVTAEVCAGTTQATCPAATRTALTGSPFTFGAAVLSNTFSNLTPGVLYAFSVQPNFAAGTSSPASAAFASPFADSLINQDLFVARPAGALVITQRCGLAAGMAAEAVTGFGTIPADVNTPGLDANGVPLANAAGTGVDLVGTAPSSGPATNSNTTGTGKPVIVGGTSPDATNFPGYPYPVDANGVSNAVFNTHCGVNLGIGQLITTGPKAGQYFTAVGRINQVTIVDTRDANQDWTLNGQAGQFTSTQDVVGFSGDYLGWTVKVTATSGTTLAGYTQLVTAPGPINPSNATTLAGAGLAASHAAAFSGAAGATTPANAGSGKGLGIAIIDARLKLLIPLTAKTGVYSSTLTFNVI